MDIHELRKHIDDNTLALKKQIDELNLSTQKRVDELNNRVDNNLAFMKGGMEKLRQGLNSLAQAFRSSTGVSLQMALQLQELTGEFNTLKEQVDSVSVITSSIDGKIDEYDDTPVDADSVSTLSVDTLDNEDSTEGEEDELSVDDILAELRELRGEDEVDGEEGEEDESSILSLEEIESLSYDDLQRLVESYDLVADGEEVKVSDLKERLIEDTKKGKTYSLGKVKGKSFEITEEELQRFIERDWFNNGGNE